jgi:RNA polymerase sigma factor (TIGR02999 family)
VDGNRVATLITNIEGGDRQAAEELLPLVYDELRRLARALMARERPQTLQATALVHEAYLRLVGSEDPGWEGRRHFFGAAARAMRRLLIERARRSQQQKRGAGLQFVAGADEVAAPAAPATPDELIAVDRCLHRLEAEDPRMVQVVELRFFVGFTEAEAAGVMDCSERTVRRLWFGAKAWLRRELGRLEQS